MRNGTVWTRRMALLGAAGLVAGCDTLDDIFGERKKPLLGERRAVLQPRRNLEADTALAAEPMQLPPAETRADWPVPGGNIGHDPGHLALPGSLREAWRASVGDGSGYRRRITAGPVVAEGTVYAADAFGVVSAYDLGGGGRRWRFDTRPKKDDVGAVGGGCAYDSGTLYVASGMAELLALDPATGQPRWRIRLPAPARGAPAVANGRIFIPTLNNYLTAYSTEDGKELWNYRAQNVPALPLGLPTPAVSEDFVVAGFASGELVALRPEDGRVHWTESLAAGRGGLGDISGIRGLPVIDRGRVYASGMGGLSMALDLRSGRRLWEREIGGTETPLVVGDWVFIIGGTGNLIAIGREDGRIRWLTELNAAPGDKKEDPAIFGPPLLAGERILLPSSKGEMLQIDPSSGAVAGRLRLPAGSTLPWLVASGTLVALCDNASLVAYRGA
ncbi:outer membrane protein assembly factor BamB family protein [Roseomonas marmotae]|uniref:PQQ-binding-like beta-propeller repeat protein n=1 Tax=Roseomonas marmotae TaxID=2768161 RepID=A0ABS3KE48_9PROT|nr:PQQ-binding-like beta-propeller repeat protein [Roseomonas marmotae]MBO1075705.1 PQQ-binding-like beta-propeller repeat protein [Roseomonas marmotae]QTI80436.1 PQQ-binding-like beta-propeller repeat protein [Roseomonas marmotae]